MIRHQGGNSVTILRTKNYKTKPKTVDGHDVKSYTPTLKIKLPYKTLLNCILSSATSLANISIFTIKQINSTMHEHSGYTDIVRVVQIVSYAQIIDIFDMIIVLKFTDKFPSVVTKDFRKSIVSNIHQSL